MKLHSESKTVKRGGVGEEKKFSIKANAKAFRVLSDNLYSDKVGAVMRELSTNAHDSHIDAGKADIPFSVHIPTDFEPFFAVEDYGTGLSHDDVMEIYTTYFESTRNDSNEVTGALGLGSKSPFALVDSFTVVSRYNGEENIYTAFISEDDTPTITRLSSAATTEQNGLKISFPVESGQHYNYENRVGKVYKYFPVKPTVTGCRYGSGEVKDVDYVLENENWKIREERGGATAIMGPIAYPLNDVTDLPDDEDGLRKHICQSIPIDIVFNMGDLDVSASREKLSYTKVVLENISRRIGEIIDEIRDTTKERLKDCETLWDARVLAFELIKGEYKALAKVFDGQKIFNYDGKSISAGYVKLPDDIAKSVTVTRFHNERSYRGYNRFVTRKDHPNAVHAAKGTRMFLQDIERGSHIRAKSVLEEENVEAVYLISGPIHVINKLRKELGFKSLAKISSIDRKVAKDKVKGGYNPKNAAKVFVYENNPNLHDRYAASSYWRKEKVDLDAGGIYVKIERYKINGDDPASKIRSYRNALNLIGESMDDITVVGAKWQFVSEKLEPHKGWITLHEFVKERVRAYCEANDVNGEIKRVADFNAISHDSTIIKAFGDECKGLASDHIIKEFYNLWMERVNESRKVNTKLHNLAAYYRLTDEDESPNILATLKEQIEARYPLLQAFDYWRVSEWREHLIEYVGLIDKKNEESYDEDLTVEVECLKVLA